MDVSIVDKTHNSSIAIVYAGTNTTQKYRLSCPFIWDELRVHCATAGALAPLVPSEPNLFEITSSHLPADENTFVLCNSTNTYNPVATFWNHERQSFGDRDYKLNVINIGAGALVTEGVFVITLEYIRYGTK